MHNSVIFELIYLLPYPELIELKISCFSYFTIFKINFDDIAVSIMSPYGLYLPVISHEFLM